MSRKVPIWYNLRPGDVVDVEDYDEVEYRTVLMKFIDPPPLKLMGGWEYDAEQS